MKYFFCFSMLLLTFVSCKNDPKITAYEDVENVFFVEIKTPAGETDSNAFLPYPGNLGYLTSDQKTEILVLSESAEKGTKIPVQPIGTLILKENNQIRHIIITSPVDSTMKLSQTINFQQFITQNAGEKQIIQDWFLYQKGLGKVELVGWEDERFALKLLLTENP